MSELALQLIAENKKTKAKSLDLGNCGLTEVPEEIGELVWLEKLNFSSTWHELNSRGLKHIRSSNRGKINQITSFSPLLSNLKELKTLVFNYNPISDVSPIENLSKLQQLLCRNTEVADLTSLIALNNLKNIDCSFTKVSNLNPLSKQYKLQRLLCNSTPVDNIVALSNLSNLKWLECSFTQITDISPLAKHTKLNVLICSNTLVKDLQPLANLKNLYWLNCDYTHVNDLSPILQIIKKGISVKYALLPGDRIDCIYLENCPLINPPIEIVKQGNKAILNYFEEKEKYGTDQIYEAKLLLIGEGGAGKTSLRYKLFNPTSELPKEQESTRGINIQPLYFHLPNGKQFRLNVWDFAGQGKYQSAHSFFYTHRSLYMLVDDTRTLNENDAYVIFYYYWLQTVDLFGGNSPLLVLHNQKADHARTGFNLGSFQAIFPFVKELFRINLGGNDIASIEDMKAQIERWAQKLPHIGEIVPKTWVKIRENIEIEGQNYPYISVERYREICFAQGIQDQDRQLELSRYFHDLGVFLHFQDNPLLRRDIFLQNQWIINAVYKILDNTHIIENKRGRFDKTDLARIWSEDPYARIRIELLALMLQFEICYQIQDTDIYISPQLLPGDVPIYELGEDIPLQLRYDYDFIPQGLFYRLIVRLHRYIAQKQSLVWKNGVVLERIGAKSCILASLDRRQISIQATGTRAKELITIIIEEIERLHETYGDRLKVEVKIPCNCRICKIANPPNFYDKNDLDTRFAKGKKTIECSVSYENINVQRLLDGVMTEVIDDVVPIEKKDKPIISTNMENQVTKFPPLLPRTIKIFLASSEELRKDRDDFDLYFRQQNDHLPEEKGIYLKIVRWENFLDAMSETRLQDEYNQEVKACDIFVSLFFTKTGKYTREEFNVAHEQFKNTKKPQIFTFFKDELVKPSQLKEFQTVERFKKKLGSLGHFHTSYDNIEHLKRQFRDQLDRLLREGKV